MEPLRTFIAVELPGDVKSKLTQLQNNLRQCERGQVKWVDANGIHLTLKFLGNIDAGQVSVISNAITEATKGIQPFSLELGMFGIFPSPRAPRVIWIGLAGDTTSLLALQKNVEQALIPLGFPSESRNFSPHLTLGRVRDRATQADRRNLGDAISAMKVELTSSFEVGAVSLMRSQLMREGARYSCLYSAVLERH